MKDKKDVLATRRIHWQQEKYNRNKESIPETRMATMRAYWQQE
jgi:hypothetical protein